MLKTEGKSPKSVRRWSPNDLNADSCKAMYKSVRLKMKLCKIQNGNFSSSVVFRRRKSQFNCSKPTARLHKDKAIANE